MRIPAICSVLLLSVWGFCIQNARASAPAQGGTPITVTVLSTTNASCLGINNGSATVSSSGGTAPYTYSWSPSGGIDSVATNLAPGVYTVYVTDAAQNSGMATVTIGENSPVLISLLSESDHSGYNISCHGGSDGSLLTTATGGNTGNYDSLVYDYSGAVQTFVVPAGVYEVFMKVWGAQGGANWVNNTNFGGYAEGGMPVMPGETLYVYVGQQPTGTAGGWNGGGAGDGAGAGGGGASDIRQGGNTLNDRVIVGGAGGGAGYWSNMHVIGGIGGGLTGGDGYRHTTADMGGLGATQSGPGANGTCVSFNVTALAGAFGLGGTPLGQNCGCEGYGGGAGWYGGAGSGNCRGGGGGSSYISGLSNAGTTGGVRAGHGRVVIQYPLPAFAYTYSWSSGAADSIATGLSAGDHILTVTASGGCMATDTFTLTEPSEITIMLSATDEINGNDGSVSLSVSGGVGPYSFLWSNNATTQNLSNVPAGVYTVTVTDANQCTKSAAITVKSRVGLENNGIAGFSLYPNPVSEDVFYIDFSTLQQSAYTLKITDVTGRTVFLENGAHKTTEPVAVPVGGWRPGTYFVTLENEGKKITRALVIR